MAFTSAVRRLFGGKGDPLRIDANLKTAAALLATATKADDKFFEQLAKEHAEAKGQQPTKPEIRLQSKKLRADIHMLGDHLEGLRSHVEVARLKKGRISTNLARITLHTTVVVAQTYFENLSKFTDEAKKLLLPLFKDSPLADHIKGAFVEEITALLSTHVDGPIMVEELKEAAKLGFPPVSLDKLKLAVMKGIAYVSPERGDTLLKALQELPNVQAQGQKVPFKDLMLVFGDKFIAESGLEGGDSTRPYCQLMGAFIKDRQISTPKAMQMQEMAENMIDLKEANLTGEKLRLTIKEKLAAYKGDLTPKCLFNAGWVGHGIVYEVEQQKDGRYTFRVFNRGEGANLHDQLQGKYGTTEISCIEIKDIPKKKFYKKNFLASLIGLSKLSKDGINDVKPAELLVYHLLPMLGGTKGETDPRIQRFLSAQISGTCPYASSEAWAANQMTAEEFVQFQCDFKTYLLECNYPDMITAGREIITEKKIYSQKRLFYSAIKRSLEDFATSLKQTQNRIPNAKIEAAENWILRTQVELVKMDKQLLDYEKKIYSLQLREGIFCQNVLLSFPKSALLDIDLEKITATVVGIPEENMLLMPKILKLPSDITCQDFAKDLETCLATLASIAQKDSCSTGELCDLTDSLLKRLGPLSNWRKIQFADAGKSMDALQTLAKALCKNLAWNKDYDFKSESYLRYLNVVFGMEAAFYQCKPEECILNKNLYASMISEGSVQKHLSSLRCADPFWVSMREQMIKLGLDKHPHPFSSLSLDKKESLEFKPCAELVGDIIHWWEGDSNESLRAKVEISVQEDRKTQEMVIAQQIKAENEAIETQKKLITVATETIKPSKAEILKVLIGDKSNTDPNLRGEIEASINNCHRVISQHNLNITAIPDRVKNDSTYWPPGFETTGKTSLAADKRATFLLHKQIGKRDFYADKLADNDLPILPARFREYANMALLTGNIFTKVGELKNYFNFSYEVDEKNALKDIALLRLDQDPVGFLPTQNPYQDPYTTPIKDSAGQPVAKAYERIFAQNLTETFIPSSTTTSPIEGLEDETLRSLMCLRSERDVQIESVLSYFQEHSDQLLNNGKLNLFHALLFDSDLLLKELTDEKHAAVLLPWMQEFFASTIKNAQELKKFHTAANMLWVASNIQKYVDFVSADRVQAGKQPLAPIIKASQYIELMEKGTDAQYASQWPILGEAFLAGCGEMLKGELKTDESEQLFAYGILAHMLTTKYALAQNEACAPRREQAALAVMTLKKRYTESMVMESQSKDSLTYLAPEKLAEMVNKFDLPILKAVYPFLKTEKFTYDSFQCLLASNDDSRLNLMAGELIPSDPNLLRVYNNPVPKNIEDELKHQGVYSNENLAHLRCYTEDNVTYIHDAIKNLELKIIKTINAQVIHIQPPGFKQWGVFISKQEKKNVHLDNIELQEKYHPLVIQNELHLCDLKTFKPIYKSNCGKLEKSHPTDSSKKLYLSKIYSSPFSSFEADQCTSLWRDPDDVLQEINFSRLGITLLRENVQGKVSWRWDENKEWTLAKEQFVPHFGQDTGFLVFENAKGKKRALIPVWEPQIVKKQALNYPYLFNHEEKTVREGRYVECDMAEGRVIPCSLEARFYLAKIYLEKGEIDWAEELLFAHVAELTHTAFSNEEKAMLTDVIKQQQKTLFAKGATGPRPSG